MAEVAYPGDIIDLTSYASPIPEPAAAELENPTPQVPDSTRKSQKARRKKEAKPEQDFHDDQRSARGGRKRKTPDTPSDEISQDRQRGRKGLDETFRALQEADSMSHAEDDLFFIDVEAMPVAPQPTAPTPEPVPDGNALLLPAHVTVFCSTPVEIIAPTTSLDDDSIQFLDYDDAKELIRYYENPTALKAPSRVVCKKCGAENQHKTSECMVVICLTCGVRDEHPTRSCPISKVCFNCGMKGHISAKCPNRYTKGIPSSRFMDCDRCYSSIHKTNECPTWWRMYLYLSDEGKANVVSFRNERRELKLGEGGEGYVANDEWCYNCGGCGHWGDDCPESTRPDRPQEPSAFSLHNVASGPFYDPAKDGEHSTRKQRVRHLDSFLELEHVPDDVGRMGKEKAKSRLGKMLKDRVADDDPDDWFSRAGSKASDKNNSSGKTPPTQPRGKTFNFGQSFRDRRDFQPASGGSSGTPSLLSRLGDTYQSSLKDKPYQRYQGEGAKGPSSSKSKRKRDRRDIPRSPDHADNRPRDNRDRRDHRNDKDNRSYSRQDRDGGSGSGGPRYRGSYNR